ncbi:hypothetical protein GCM10010411_28200 [Actinomadura fulvescens]|uniref:Oxidoreductase N-terminal domain-containing protein n=1 Tax=Actinomadura fulvescens TaxID=46160 RepID=A0ABN3PQA9_9ACTN
MLTGRAILLTSRPVGEVGPEHFALVRVRVAAPRPGQLLVRNTWMSLEPYLRHDPGLASPHPGEVIPGEAVGEVIDSLAAAVPVHAPVAHFAGWREYAVVNAADTSVIDTTLSPAETYLGSQDQIIQGLDRAPTALIAALRGRLAGTVLVRLS